jgi:probable rRNA maturation factor
VSSTPPVQLFVFEQRISDERWFEKLGDVDALLANVMIPAANETRTNGGVAILFTDDAEMRQLNKQWRNLDMPTDVLSFPSSGPELPGEPRHLGDIALGYETALRDAETMNRPFEAHISHLLIHGFLHLLGYDHIDLEDAAVMEPLEIKILAGLGLPDPYATGPYAGDPGKA